MSVGNSPTVSWLGSPQCVGVRDTEELSGAAWVYIVIVGETEVLKTAAIRSTMCLGVCWMKVGVYGAEVS